MDVVILLLALVAAALAAFAAVAALRAMRAAADASSQIQLALTAIDQAGEAISAVNAALLDARSTVGQISRQQAVDTAVVRERLESVSAQVAQVGERADGLRREVTAGRTRRAKRSSVSSAPFARITRGSSIACARRWTRSFRAR